MSADVLRENSLPSSTGHVDSRTRLEPMPSIAHQYALPILPRNSSQDGHGGGDETPRVEYTLRRKTPNGTLNAGYDTADDSLNPQKHQLVVNEGIAPVQPYAPPVTAKRTFLEHQQLQHAQHSSWSTPTGYGWSGSQYLQPHALPVMDSMLHQMPMQHVNAAQQFYGQTVPSVIQPSFQYLGPTASGGQGSGPYGPYWHDGTFVPYRPAALRDPRFYHHPASHWRASPSGSFPAHHTQQWQQRHSSSQPVTWTNSPGFASTDPYHTHNHHHQIGPIYPPQSNPVQSNAYGTHLLPPVTGPVWQEQQGCPLDLDAEFGPLSSNSQQRDKVFAWALQQYRDLLTYIHHNRRQQQQHNKSHGRPVQRPSFFPKPPAPTSSGSSLMMNRKRPSLNGDNAHDGHTPPLIRSETSPGGLGRLNYILRPPPPSIGSAHGLHLQGNEYHRRASYDQWEKSQHPQQWQQSILHSSDGFRTLRRTSGSSVSSTIPQPSKDDSPIGRANIALSYVTKLCQDMGWQWTDGMHLGGCLAYGLGYYPQALRWYTKVLEMEPDHLEATSNLAATMLALGQRREAEQNWIKVIKSAPNHFEAVEHLVGLLCNDHRSADAVRVIEYVERCLRQAKTNDFLKVSEKRSECSSSNASRSPCQSDLSDRISYEFDVDGEDFTPDWRDNPAASEPGFGSSGFAIPGCDNGRILALIHAKGNLLYGLGDNGGAARAFEDAVLIAIGRTLSNIQDLVKHILNVVGAKMSDRLLQRPKQPPSPEPILLDPEQALRTAKLCFPPFGDLPGLQHVVGGPQSIARKAAISTTSNSLLSLAKIFQDGMSNSNRSLGVTPLEHGVRDILALYYLSLSLQPSPSTANNVGILLASVQQATPPAQGHIKMEIPGVIPGSGIALALQYYNYGLQLDQGHAHLYTNLGSLLKDIGQLDAAIQMYERAVKCDGKFDIALANLANAVKDKGRISDAIVYYKRAVEVNPDFAEAVCGLANALNSVCGWQARGGIADDGGKRDRWHVDSSGMLLDACQPGAKSSGWIKRVVDIVDKQLIEGENWGIGTLTADVLEDMVQSMVLIGGLNADANEREGRMRKTLKKWAGQKWEGARVTRLIERATKRIGWNWYRDAYVMKRSRPLSSYERPQLPASLTIPSAPTVLPFHTFTCPVSAKQIRMISQRNGLRISASALRAPWLPKQVFPPPSPPAPYLRVGYVSSDFNNHPLAHLMQSVFGMHDVRRVKAFCYATTPSDNSPHRKQIEAQAPVFLDASSWSAEKLVKQIVNDGIHILVNLNGYTRGARNEIFAARPAPIQMSFMGFAGTLGAEWCDYLLADEMAIPPSTLRPWRRNVDLEDQMLDENEGGDNDDWVYGENIIYCRDTFFCCDHRQSAPDAECKRASWDEEKAERWRMRKELFPQVSDETIIFGNFNQLYKASSAMPRISRA